MTWFCFLLVLGLIYLMFPCQGKVSPPRDAVDGNKFILLPGSTVKITWSFDDVIKSYGVRLWTFRKSGEEVIGLAKIDGDGDVERILSLLEFDIEKPATLVLKNVNQSYNGTYKFFLSPSTGTGDSEVVVFIVVAPNVTFSCINITTLVKGDNFTCECRGEGGNPPANVTWYKNGVQIGKTGKEEQILSIINFGEDDRGTYTCKAQSHVNATDEDTIELDMFLKPNVTVVCSSPIIVNEGQNVICECGCEHGNPPAECTWYKNNTQIGERGIEVNTLNRSKVSGEDSGNYTCIGQSHPKARDEKSIEVTVFFKPGNTAIAFSQKFSTKLVEIGGTVTIACAFDGFPEPRFIIFHNDTAVVSTDKAYAIRTVKWSDAGTYKCFTKNALGNDSAFAILTVKELPGPIATTLRITQTVSGENAPTSAPDDGSASEQCNCKIKEWHVIVVSLVSGILGVLLFYIVLYSRHKWFRNKSGEPATEKQITAADSTYQELDLKRMNKEDNYQSLRGNAARIDGVNNDESNYTELNKIRDVESNYQSLT